MLVNELIQELRKYSKESEVWIIDSKGNSAPVEKVSGANLDNVWIVQADA